MRILEINAIRHRIRSAGWKPALLVPGVAATVFILGFAVSLGQVFLIRGYLRRAAESAAQAAAFLLREDGSLPQMTAAAEAVVRAEGLDAAALRVDTCATDPALCAPGEGPAGRKVRVTIETDFSPTPLVMLFSRGIHLEASAVGTETALDVVLVIDSSESMAWDNSPYPTLNYDEDPANPAVCNLDDSCMPFHNVKAAAADFAAAVLDKPPGEEMDRLAVVTFANGWEADSRGTRTLLGGNWTNDLSEALDPTYGIPGMHVYAATDICPLNNDMVCGGWNPIACYPTVDDIPTGPCIYVGDQSANPYSVNPFWGYNCARLWDIDTGDGDHWTGRDAAISACTTTNTGGGLYRAAEQFNYEQRPNALRVVILLTDGPANATFATESDLDPVGGGYDPVTAGFPLDPAVFVPNLPLGYCPDGTWVGRGTGHPNRVFCQDGLVDTHHSLAADPNLYDADDFARDQAKLLACAASGTPNPSCMGIFGKDALIFTIGLGDEITDLLDDNPVVPDRQPYGASLLRYIAALGDDGDAATDPCAGEPDFSASCGNYYHATGSADLPGIFDDIDDRLDALLVPAPFGKLGPADGGYASTGPTLSWDADPNALSYEYCYDTTDNGACDGAWADAGFYTSVALGGLTPESEYFWQVRAVNEHGSTEADSDDWWSFAALPVSFTDVPSTHWAWSWIERLFAAGITNGCAVSPLRYCPDQTALRSEMAVFLLRGIHEPAYAPPAATGTVFADVSGSHWAAAWIEQLHAEGITNGCAVLPLRYCPEQTVLRSEIAVFLLRAKYGPSYTPPAATGTVFGDVPASHWAAAWIEQLAAEGITSGCWGGNYCPENPVTRAEMAVFLVRTFELP